MEEIYEIESALLGTIEVGADEDEVASLATDLVQKCLVCASAGIRCGRLKDSYVLLLKAENLTSTGSGNDYFAGRADLRDKLRKRCFHLLSEFELKRLFPSNVKAPSNKSFQKTLRKRLAKVGLMNDDDEAQAESVPDIKVVQNKTITRAEYERRMRKQSGASKAEGAGEGEEPPPQKKPYWMMTSEERLQKAKEMRERSDRRAVLAAERRMEEKERLREKRFGNDTMNDALALMQGGPAAGDPMGGVGGGGMPTGRPSTATAGGGLKSRIGLSDGGGRPGPVFSFNYRGMEGEADVDDEAAPPPAPSPRSRSHEIRKVTVITDEDQQRRQSRESSLQSTNMAVIPTALTIGMRPVPSTPPEPIGDPVLGHVMALVGAVAGKIWHARFGCLDAKAVMSHYEYQAPLLAIIQRHVRCRRAKREAQRRRVRHLRYLNNHLQSRLARSAQGGGAAGAAPTSPPQRLPPAMGAGEMQPTPMQVGHDPLNLSGSLTKREVRSILRKPSAMDSRRESMSSRHGGTTTPVTPTPAPLSPPSSQHNIPQLKRVPSSAAAAITELDSMIDAAVQGLGGRSGARVGIALGPTPPLQSLAGFTPQQMPAAGAGAGGVGISPRSRAKSQPAGAIGVGRGDTFLKLADALMREKAAAATAGGDASSQSPRISEPGVAWSPAFATSRRASIQSPPWLHHELGQTPTSEVAPDIDAGSAALRARRTFSVSSARSKGSRGATRAPSLADVAALVKRLKQDEDEGSRASSGKGDAGSDANDERGKGGEDDDGPPTMPPPRTVSGISGVQCSSHSAASTASMDPASPPEDTLQGADSTAAAPQGGSSHASPTEPHGAAQHSSGEHAADPPGNDPVDAHSTSPGAVTDSINGYPDAIPAGGAVGGDAGAAAGGRDGSRGGGSTAAGSVSPTPLDEALMAVSAEELTRAGARGVLDPPPQAASAAPSQDGVHMHTHTDADASPQQRLSPYDAASQPQSLSAASPSPAPSAAGIEWAGTPPLAVAVPPGEGGSPVAGDMSAAPTPNPNPSPNPETGSKGGRSTDVPASAPPRPAAGHHLAGSPSTYTLDGLDDLPEDAVQRRTAADTSKADAQANGDGGSGTAGAAAASDVADNRRFDIPLSYSPDQLVADRLLESEEIRQLAENIAPPKPYTNKEELDKALAVFTEHNAKMKAEADAVARTALEERSAVAIQSVYRGHVARGRVLHKRAEESLYTLRANRAASPAASCGDEGEGMASRVESMREGGRLSARPSFVRGKKTLLSAEAAGLRRRSMAGGGGGVSYAGSARPSMAAAVSSRASSIRGLQDAFVSRELSPADLDDPTTLKQWQQDYLQRIELRDELHLLEVYAATTIQVFFRYYLRKCRRRVREATARVLQCQLELACAERHHTQPVASRISAQREREVADAIQGILVSRRQRGEVNALRIQVLQACARTKLSMMLATHKHQTRAAVRIQSVWKGHFHRCGGAAKAAQQGTPRSVASSVPQAPVGSRVGSYRRPTGSARSTPRHGPQARGSLSRASSQQSGVALPPTPPPVAAPLPLPPAEPPQGGGVRGRTSDVTPFKTVRQQRMSAASVDTAGDPPAQQHVHRPQPPPQQPMDLAAQASDLSSSSLPPIGGAASSFVTTGSGGGGGGDARGGAGAYTRPRTAAAAAAATTADRSTSVDAADAGGYANRAYPRAQSARGAPATPQKPGQLPIRLRAAWGTPGAHKPSPLYVPMVTIDY